MLYYRNAWFNEPVGSAALRPGKHTSRECAEVSQTTANHLDRAAIYMTLSTTKLLAVLIQNHTHIAFYVVLFHISFIYCDHQKVERPLEVHVT